MSWIAKFYMDGNCEEVVGFGRRVLTIDAVGKNNGYRDLDQVTWDGANNISPNNEISSARVMPGYRARLFRDKNYTEQELRLDKDPQHGRADFIPGEDGVMKFTYFPDTDGFRFNDAISSIYVEPYE